MTIRVAMVEDSKSFRRSLRFALDHSSGFEVVAEYSSVEALSDGLHDRRVASAAWDVVLMDLDLPGASGIEGIRRVKAVHANTQVLVCTVFEDPNTVVQAITAGADGYLLKTTPLEELLEQMQVVTTGGAGLSSGVARTLLDVVRRLETPKTPGPARLDLTGRERDVLRCLVDGRSYKETATELDITLHTVRAHIRTLYKKLQVHSVAEAVARAIREQLT